MTNGFFDPGPRNMLFRIGCRWCRGWCETI